MITKDKTSSRKHFEDFAGSCRGDVFGKAFELADYLRANGDGLLAGLGLTVDRAAGPENVLGGPGGRLEVIMLGSNSYLDLTTHPEVVAASIDACRRYGYGMGAVSLYAGLTELHKRLERAIADFYNVEDAIVFPSGYGTNVGVISALCGPGDIIINDSANHASIFDGSVLSGAELKIYPHGNMRRLERVLAGLPADKARLIITDGVFSMHGDLAKLDEIVKLAEKYNARVMVDDAHGLGVVGPGGRGTAAAFGVADKIDLNVGMLSKAPGGLGGFCAGRGEVINYLRIYSRSYFFSTALPAPLAAGLMKVFELLAADKAGRGRLWQNISYLKNSLEQKGFNIGPSQSGIIPLIVGDEEKLAEFHSELLAGGVYANIVTYPAVRRKEARLRLCVMSSLTTEQMDRALAIIEEAGRKCRII